MTCPACGYDPNGKDIQVSVLARLIFVDGVPARVTRKEAELLHLVSRCSPETAYFDWLVQSMYPGEPTEAATRRVRTMASYTKRSMDGMTAKLRTVKGVGLRFERTA